MVNLPDMIWTLLSKLRGIVSDNWSQKVLAIPKRSTSGPDIADAIHVVNDETLIVTDPVFSKIAVQ